MAILRLISISLLLLTPGSSKHDQDLANTVANKMQEMKTGYVRKGNNDQTSIKTKQKGSGDANVGKGTNTDTASAVSKPNVNTKTNVMPNSGQQQTTDSIQVVAHPESISVLVNKQNKLPEQYNPSDLVTTSIPFVSTATSEKRKMRKEAGIAIANLFAAAKKQGVSLLGVSAYRSHVTQTSLFNTYV